MIASKGIRSMNHTLAAPRLRRWGVAMAAASVGLLTLASAANATIYQPTTSPAFRQAVLVANATPGYDKIIIPTGATMSPSTNLVISDDLYITSDHTFDGGDPNFFGPALSGGSVDIRAANFITVNPGVRLIMAGIEINQASSTGFASIQNNGRLRLDNMTFISNEGNVVTQTTAAASTVVTNTTVTDSSQTQPAFLFNGGGSLEINNSTIGDTTGGGIQADGTFLLRNSVLFGTSGNAQNCYSPVSAGSTNNFTNDGTCGNDAVGDPQIDFVFYYRGPTQTRPPLAGSPLINAGDPATCVSSDQGFGVRPATGGTCDIGAVEFGAVKDTTIPSCVVTATRRGPDEQDVTVSDTGAGIGYDTVFPEQITITNGTVAFTGLPPLGALPPAPSRPGNTVLTAVKANQAARTTWSFIARDWAGNTRTCS